MTYSEKERLELEKVKLEIESLRRPAVRRLTFWFSAASVILAIVGVGTQGYLTKIETANAERKMYEALDIREEAHRELLEIQDQRSGLLAEMKTMNDNIAALKGTAQRLREANDELVSNVSSVSKSGTTVEEQSRIITTAKNARYSIGIYGFSVPYSDYQRVRKWLVDEGYSINQGDLLSSRPSWLSYEPTVLYYDKDSRALALRLAESLKDLTGLKFGVRVGSGVGVVKGEEAWTFFIHMIE